MIPAQGNAEFAAAMEKVLDVYRRPYDPAFPVVCMDETPRQLIGQTRVPVPAAPGRPAREDYEYKRYGTCSVFIATEPLAGKRMTKVTEHKTKLDWAQFLADIAARYTDATKITLVMENLNTHRPGALYEAFAPAQAKALWNRFEFIYTPKHGSWLNVAEAELNVLIRQCLNRRAQVARAAGENQEAGVVGDKVQTVELNAKVPADPAVARSAPQRRCREHQERQP